MRRRQEVEAQLQHFAELDPYVARRPGHTYFVRSLYFDDRAHSAFHDKVDGMLTRSKFRIRTYGHGLDDPAPWFLEIKGRHNNLVFKHRTPLAGGFDKRASGYELSKVLLRHAAPGTVLEKIQQYSKRSNMLHIEPSGDGRNLRLTYDITLLEEATAGQLTTALSRTDGVSNVVLIVSKNDVDY